MKKKFDVVIQDKDRALSEALGFIQEQLSGMKLIERDINRAVLMCEESLLSLLKHADFSRIQYFTVNARKVFGDVIIDLNVPGDEFDFYGRAEDMYSSDDDELQETQSEIQSLLLRSFSRFLKYKHYRRFNSVRIKAVLSNYSELYRILTVLFLAIVSGIVLKSFFPESVYMAVNDNIFVPVRTVFMNGLKMCAVPVVLFSIINCISGMGSVSGIRKSAGRLIKYILIFQIASTAIGFSLMYVFRTGAGVNMPMPAVETAPGGSVSLMGMLVNLVPSNIVRPLLEGDMMQIMVISVILGISVGMAGVKILRDVFSELTAVFMGMTRIFMLIVPLAVFCSVSSMVITTGLNTLLSVLGMLLTLIAGYVLLNIFYCAAVKVRTGLSPLIMLRKSLPMIITAFSTLSSIASVPDGMKCCDNMGIFQKIYSLSIPLCTSVCKAAFPIILSILTLSAANMYGVEISALGMISLALSVIVLTISKPGLPGSGIIALSALLAQAGCPLEFLGIALSIDVLGDLFSTTTTCIGNIACTIIAADGGGLIDRVKYAS